MFNLKATFLNIYTFNVLDLQILIMYLLCIIPRLRMSILPISYVRISQFHLPIPTQKCHMSKMRVKGHSGEKKEEKEEKKKKKKTAYE